MVKVIYSTSEDQNPIEPSIKIFLAGTIDLGNSIDWQKQVEDYYKKSNFNFNITIFNPRTVHYNDDNIRNQINWELNHLEEADIIIMNILGNSKSPISLMELGLYAKSDKLYVICEKDFYRYTNVEETCKFYNIKLKNSLEDFLGVISPINNS